MTPPGFNLQSLMNAYRKSLTKSFVEKAMLILRKNSELYGTIKSFMKRFIGISNQTRFFLVSAIFFISSFAEEASFNVTIDDLVATDRLGRKLQSMEEAGPERPDKTVALFYYTWTNRLHNPQDLPVFDLTKINAAGFNNSDLGPNQHFHHWGESELGYYQIDDPYVMKKHLRMFILAKVDVLFLDATNAITYFDQYIKLCKIYEEERLKGYRVPRIAFFTRSGSGVTVKKIYDEFYAKNLYPNLWFYWKGKPIILGIEEEISEELKAFFTVRECWAWGTAPWFGDGKNKWTWLDNVPQMPGWSESKRKTEEVSITTAQHPNNNIGKSFSQGKEPHIPQSDEGIYFQEQADQALKIDPEILWITQWNEWIAQRFIVKEGERSQFLGKELGVGDTFFVDLFSQEFNRDIEPMKGGYGDNYYYQMVNIIRRYKGMKSKQAYSHSNVKIDGKFDEWKEISPEYCDFIGDVEHRDYPGWCSANHYLNKTGRHDIQFCKVERVSTRLYFYMRCGDSIENDNEPYWMNLYINTDQNATTGWLGYDFRVGKKIASGTRELEKWIENRWMPIGTAHYSVKGTEMEMEIKKSDLWKSESMLQGVKNALRFDKVDPIVIDFHWIDNMAGESEDDFLMNGDSAPDRRFNFHYEN